MGTGTLIFFICMVVAAYFLQKKWDARLPDPSKNESAGSLPEPNHVEADSNPQLEVLEKTIALLTAAADKMAADRQRMIDTVAASDATQPEDGFPERDAWEATRTDGLEPAYNYQSNVELEFDYMDSNGSRSHRRFTTRWFEDWMDDTILLTGFCHKRKARRSFRADQMANVVDVETGEIIANVKQYMMDQYQASKFYVIDTFIEDWGDVFDCLFFVCRADGNISASQRAFITECAASIIKDDRVLPEDLKSILTTIDQRMTPASYRRAVNRVKRSSPHQVDQLKNWTATLSALRKSGSPLAKTFLEYIDKPLAKTKD